MTSQHSRVAKQRCTTLWSFKEDEYAAVLKGEGKSYTLNVPVDDVYLPAFVANSSVDWGARVIWEDAS